MIALLESALPTLWPKRASTGSIWLCVDVPGNIKADNLQETLTTAVDKAVPGPAKVIIQVGSLFRMPEPYLMVRLPGVATLNIQWPMLLLYR